MPYGISIAHTGLTSTGSSKSLSKRISSFAMLIPNTSWLTYALRHSQQLVTGTDLLNAIVLDKLPVTTDVQAIANYRLITVESGDYLFNALILMTLHQIDRVVVMQSSELHGIIPS